MAAYTPNTWTTGDVVTKAKLDRLEAGAAAALPSVDAAPVATSGAYADLGGKPTIPTTAAQVGADPAGTGAAAAAAAQAAAVQRANHTGTQAASTITGLAPVATSGAYADLTGKPATAGLRTDFQPSDHNLLAWSFDPALIIGGSGFTAGTLYMVKMRVPVAATITNILLSVSTAGATLTAGQCFAALYDSSRALLATTADQATAWATTGLKTMPLSSPQTVTAGDYYVGFWAVGGTPPQIFRGSGGTTASNVGLTSATNRFGSSTTGLTTTAPNPAAVPATVTASWWIGLS